MMLGPAEEMYFWSGIMRDHAEFILSSLSYRETSMITVAQQYKTIFSGFHNKVMTRRIMPDEGLAMIDEVLTPLAGFINYKRILLNRLMECNVELTLPPTFVNHMINEALDFYKVLCLWKSEVPSTPVEQNINLHKLWLPDAAGHAAAIASDLDPVEAAMIKEAQDYKNSFEHLFIKAGELGKMLERACLDDGALSRLNEEAVELINSFIDFLTRVFELRRSCGLLGVMKPLLADHMIREEKYYLLNLGKFMAE